LSRNTTGGKAERKIYPARQMRAASQGKKIQGDSEHQRIRAKSSTLKENGAKREKPTRKRSLEPGPDGNLKKAREKIKSSRLYARELSEQERKESTGEGNEEEKIKGGEHSRSLVLQVEKKESGRGTREDRKELWSLAKELGVRTQERVHRGYDLGGRGKKDLWGFPFPQITVETLGQLLPEKTSKFRKKRKEKKKEITPRGEAFVENSEESLTFRRKTHPNKIIE